MKEESEKAGFKLNIQKTKVITSCPITSWQTDREIMETVGDFIFWAPKSLQMVTAAAAAAAKSLQSCLTLCNPIDDSPPSFPVPGILQARTLELQFPSPLFIWELKNFACAMSSVVQSLSHVWLWDPMDCSTPGFSVLHCLPEFAQIHVHWGGDAI